MARMPPIAMMAWIARMTPKITLATKMTTTNYIDKKMAQTNAWITKMKLLFKKHLFQP